MNTFSRQGHKVRARSRVKIRYCNNAGMAKDFNQILYKYSIPWLAELITF